MIDRNLLKVALSTIHEDESGRPFSSGKFYDLVTGLHVSFIEEGDRFRDTFFHFEHVHKDIWNLQTIILRLEWQKGIISRGWLDDDVGSQFAACDIGLFHVQYRSLFDRLAKIVGRLSGRPKTVPDSFRKLREWVGRPGNARRVDQQLARFVTSCDWFDDMREVRDSIVHKDGRAFVFPQENRILFQVHEGFGRRTKIHLPEIMFNESVADFELYAGLLMGYLIACLEDISAIAEQILKARRTDIESRVHHGGLRVLRSWIERVYTLK